LIVDGLGEGLKELLFQFEISLKTFNDLPRLFPFRACIISNGSITDNHVDAVNYHLDWGGTKRAPGHKDLELANPAQLEQEGELELIEHALFELHILHQDIARPDLMGKELEGK